MPFHGNQAGKLLGISFPFTTALLFKNPPIPRQTWSTPNTRKLGAFTSLKSLQATLPEKEGVNHLRSKEIIPVTQQQS